MNLRKLKLPDDIRRMAIDLVKGHEARQLRDMTEFDTMALMAVDQARNAICEDIYDIETKCEMQKKVYQSSVYNVPWELMGNVYCGRTKFYSYRREFIKLVAINANMIKW